VFSLHGSEYIRHYETDDSHPSGCLKTSEIGRIIEKDRSSTLYHLGKLEEGGLIERFSRLQKGQAVLMWKITKKWLEFVDEFNLDSIIREYLKERYPNLYINQ